VTDRLRNNLADLADEVVPADLRDRVVLGSYRASTRRAYLAIAVGLLLVVTLVGFGLSRPRVAEPVEPPPGSGLPRGNSEPLVEPAPPWRPGPLAAATFTVPPFNHSECPYGEVTTVDGVVAYPSHPFGSAIAVLDAFVMDVDRDGTDDVVATVACTHNGEPTVHQVLALTRDGAAYRTLGTVVATDGVIQGIYGLTSAPDAAVVVQVGDREFSQRESANRQARWYRFDGGRFVQVEGPTEFESQESAVALRLRATARLVVDPGGGRWVDVSVRVDNSGAILAGRLRLLFDVTAYLQPVGPGWARCFRDAAAREGSMMLVECPISMDEFGNPFEATYRLLLPADPALVPEQLVLTVDQLSPAQTERDLTDNRVAVDLP
jgi:hypothetical protein